MRNHCHGKALPFTSSKKKPVLVTLFLFAFFFRLHAQNCTINAGVDQTICANGTMTLSGTKNGLFQGAGTTTWSQVSGSAVTITSPNNLTTTATGFAAGTYTFRLSTTCLDGSAIFDDVVITVSPIVIANAGPDQTFCPGSGTLAGNAPAPGTGAWTTIGANNAGLTVTTAASATSAITLPTTSAGATTLRWTITQGSCTSTDDVIITNRGGATPVNAGPDQTLGACYTSTTSATLAGSFGGSNVSGQGGLWTLISGPNTPTITTASLRNTTVTNLVQGVYVFRWTVSGPCVNGFDDVQITVPAPSASLTAANAGGNQVYCDGRTTVVLTGNNPSYSGETVQWTQTAGPAATISSPTTPVTTITGLNGTSSYTFVYTITNSTTGCTSTNSAQISYNTAPSITVNGGNDFINLACGASSTSVAYTVSGGSTTQYRIIAAPAGYSLPGSYTNSGGSPQSLTGLTIPGTYTVRFQRTGGTGCSLAYDDVNVVVSQTPSPSEAGTYQTLACNVVNTSLAGNIPTTGAGTWSQVSGPNTASITNPALYNSGITGLVNGRYIFKWIISGGNACPASEDTVSVVVASTTPTAADAGPDKAVCNATPLTLQGNTPALNETGTWSVSPSAGITFSNANSPSAVVNGLQPSTVYTFTWTITNACGTTTDDVIITADANAGPAQATAGTDICLPSGTTSSTLSGNSASPVGAVSAWSQASGPNTATIAAPAGASSSITGLSNGTYQFVRTFTLTGCNSTTDTVLVTVSPAATVANAGTDQTICAATATLSANNPLVGTGSWSQVAGPGGATLSSATQNTPTLSGLAPGSYTFRWSISNGGCPGNFDDVVVNVSSPPAVANAGPDQNCLTTTTATLAAAAVTSGTGVWSQVGGPAPATITTAASASSGLTGLNNGTYTFRWTVSGGQGCAPTTDDMVITVNQTATAGGNVTLCNTTVAALSGNANSSGTWSQISGPNTATLRTLSGFTSSAEGLIPGAYVFRYTLTPAGSCAASFADKTVTITAPPSTAIAGSNQSVCSATSFSLNATAPTTGTGAWSKVSGPASGSFSSTASPTASFNSAATGLYTFQWTVTSGGCSNASQITVNNSPAASVADAGPDQSFCGPSSTTMAAVAPASGTGTWAQLSGPSSTTIQYPSLATTSVSGVAAGTYYFRWTVTSGACTPTTDDVKLVVCGVLPVRLVSFGVERKAGAALLQWRTAEEKDFAGFTLERSVNGGNFIALAEIAGKGAIDNDYRYTDALAAIEKGTVQYRLRLKNNDGSFSYSQVAKILWDKTASLTMTVMPNPVQSKIAVQVNTDKGGDALIGIADGNGKVLLTESRKLTAGNNAVTLLEERKLPNGIYIISIHVNGKMASEKLIIQR